MRLTLSLLARAFAAWKQRYLRFKRLEHLKRRALQRFLNVMLAKTFQPWAAMARQTAKNRQDADAISNFEQVDRCRKRIYEIHQSLARIFTTDPTTGVFTP